MIYKSDLKVKLDGTQLVWAGGVDVIPKEGAVPIARFEFDTVDYNHRYEGKAIKDMTEEEFTGYVNMLTERVIDENSKFITEYSRAIDDGSFKQETE